MLYNPITSAFNVTSQTTTYSAVINDYVICSSSSFTVTLPTAVGVSGKSIGILHNGTSLTQVYTLNTTSAQTIGGIGSGNYALYTNGEALVVFSDGSNWQVSTHKTETGWVDAGNITLTGTTTNPVKGAISTDHIRWIRKGAEAIIRVNYIQSGAGSSTTGSGDYLIALPFTADGTTYVVDTTVYGNAHFNITNSLGSVTGSITSTTNFDGAVVLYDTTHVRFIGLGTDGTNGNRGAWSSGYGPLTGGSSVGMNAVFRVIVSGWQP